MLRSVYSDGAVIGLTHMSDNFRVGNVVGDDFGHFGKVPSIPFLSALMRGGTRGR